MKDITKVPYHPVAEKIVDVICEKTQNNNRGFFRILVAYYLTKLASMMRVDINTHDRGKIPINMYAINLAPSGYGKGYSTNIMEELVIKDFRKKFLEETFIAQSEKHLAELAKKRAIKKDTDEDVELLSVTAEFRNAGELLFSFDSGTTAAVKQMRHKLLMANAGSMNMEIDEIGSNLLGNVDVLKVFFELFDVGKVKQKLVKNTAENLRGEEIHGRTPTNMMLFGTPSKLLDGSKTEEETISMLDAGMARRCFFHLAKGKNKISSLTPQQVYDMLTNKQSSSYLVNIANKLSRLADITHFGTQLDIDKDVSLLLIEYKLHCEKLATHLKSHEFIKKAELEHRYFKVLKLAGTYAFIDNSPEVTEDHIYNAIRLAEDSGKALDSIVNRDRNYVKLAKYIADIDKELTEADLVQDLPFYKGSAAQKSEMMTLAIAHGYKNNIVIKTSFSDGIKFFKGESLKQTDLSKIPVSYGTNYTENYLSEHVPFEKLYVLTQKTGYHWMVHHLQDGGIGKGYRNEENILEGFNLVVLDVDEGVSINTAKFLMKDFKYLIYTTKSHTDKHNRFRIIMPMTHRLDLNRADYTKFMKNVYEWLPFHVDTATSDRARKWETFNGTFEYNDGNLLNSLLFIPKTAKNDERKKFIADHQSMSNMERWFIRNTADGNRSNQLIKYALMLVDSGQDFTSVQNNVSSLNKKLQDPLGDQEILTTIMQTAAKAIGKRDAQ